MTLQVMPVPSAHLGASSLAATTLNPSLSNIPPSSRTSPPGPSTVQPEIIDLAAMDDDDSDLDSLDSFHTAVIDICSPSPPPVDLTPLRTARDARIADALLTQGVVPCRRAMSVSGSDSDDSEHEAVSSLPTGTSKSRPAKRPRSERQASVAETYAASDIVIQSSPSLDFAMPMADHVSFSTWLEPHRSVDEPETRQESRALGGSDIGLGLMIENMVNSVMNTMGRLEDAPDAVESTGMDIGPQTSSLSVQEGDTGSTSTFPPSHDTNISPDAGPPRRSRRPSTPPLPPDFGMAPDLSIQTRRVPLTPPGPPPLSPPPTSIEFKASNRPATPPLPLGINEASPTSYPMRLVPRTPSVSPPPTPKESLVGIFPGSIPSDSAHVQPLETRSSKINRLKTEEAERRKQLLLSRLQALNTSTTRTEVDGDYREAEAALLSATTVAVVSSRDSIGKGLSPASHEPTVRALVPSPPPTSSSNATRSVSMLDRIEPLPTVPTHIPRNRTESAPTPSTASLLDRIGGVAPSPIYPSDSSSSVARSTPTTTPKPNSNAAVVQTDTRVQIEKRDSTGAQEVKSLAQSRNEETMDRPQLQQRLSPRAVKGPLPLSPEHRVASTPAVAVKAGEPDSERPSQSSISPQAGRGQGKKKKKKSKAPSTTTPSAHSAPSDSSLPASSLQLLTPTSPKELRKPSLVARMGRDKPNDNPRAPKAEPEPMASVSSASSPVRAGLLERMSSNAALPAESQAEPANIRQRLSSIGHFEPSAASKQDPLLAASSPDPTPSLASRLSRTSATNSLHKSALIGSRMGTSPVPPARHERDLTPLDPALIESVMNDMRIARSQCMRGYEIVFTHTMSSLRKLLEQMLTSLGSEVIDYTSPRLMHEPSADVQRIVVDSTYSARHGAHVVGARRVTGEELWEIVHENREKEGARKGKKANDQGKPVPGLLARMGKGTRSEPTVPLR